LRLAGTYHPIAYLVERLDHFIPGIETVNAVWKDRNNDLQTENGTVSKSDASGKLNIQKWRTKNIQYEWSNSFNPLNLASPSLKQLALSDENELNVLLIYFNSTTDNLKDIIAIHFPQHLFLGNLNATFSGLTTKEKSILSNILSSMLYAEHERCLKEFELLKQIELHQNQQSQKITQLTSNLKQSEQLYTSALKIIVQDILKVFEENLSKSISIENNVILRLAKERISKDQITDILEKAIHVAYNLSISSNELIIHNDLIHIEELKSSNKQSEMNSEYDKVKLLLDRYEVAAENARDNGHSVNGKNVARHLDPPVTPPAITDAIKKNEKKIHYYLDKYPNHWRLIRTKLRPLQIIDDELGRNYQGVG
jgi:hypothetical protein